ncbi:MAG: ribulose-phosphate 3-epimerase [Ruminococcaceae bacterium]|nr:ribulose-phosphate 3-epimerase [Oscillospiraceae bacterium]
MVVRGSEYAKEVRCVKISPSIMTCDFSRLDRAVAAADGWNVDRLHLDVMDGVFVPNLSFGPPVIASLRPLTALPFDVHLMVQEPSKLLEAYVKAGADMITIHAECSSPLEETLRRIREAGCKVGLSLNPDTPVEVLWPYLPLLDMVLVMTVQPGFGGQSFRPECLPKITAIRAECDRRGLDIDIQVDGGVKDTNVREVAAAGATSVVMGSALYNAADPTALITLTHSL